MLGRTNTGGGGGGLNFKVVGGTTAPNNPKDNTIWVNTDTAITSYVFAATEPTDPIEGMVWIRVGTSSGIKFNALKKNTIQVYPLSAKQYVNGAWVGVTAKTYQSGVWNSWALNLFKSGLGIADGHSINIFTKTSGASVSAEGIVFSTDKNGGGAFQIEPAMDVTSRRKLFVELVTTTRYGESSVLKIGLSKTMANWGTLEPYYALASLSWVAQITPTWSTDRRVVEVPITTDINEPVYITVVGYAITGTVYNIWME